MIRLGSVDAGDLKIGQKVTGPDGDSATVVSTVYEAHPEGVPVFNFEVEDYHTYFVKENGARGPPVWVHNACASPARKYITYVGDDLGNPGKKYVGRASGFGTKNQILDRRLSSHHRRLANARVTSETRSRGLNRGYEQYFMDLEENRGRLTNQIRGISLRKRAELRKYMEAVRRALSR